MDAHDLWIKFTKDGKLEDYLEYRRHLEMHANMDLGNSYDSECFGTRDEGP